MITRLFTAALVAGLVAGLAVAVLQQFTTTPLILAAETYESGHTHAAPAAQGGNATADDGAWAPEDGLERALMTALSAVATAFGYGLILLGAMLLAGERIAPRTGLIWGLAGFAAVGLAPALGLSPELPGSAAADLDSRQLWWFGTAIVTATGLWLILRIASPLAIAAGIVLLAAPHLLGAPHPDEFTSPVPGELSGHFAAASLVVHAVTWALVGAVAGFVWRRGETDAAA